MKTIKPLTFLSYYLAIISGVLLVIANLFEAPYMGMACGLVLSASIVSFCVSDFTKRIGLSIFMACMFTFQLGGVILPAIIGDSDWTMGLSYHEYILTCTCLYISCVALMLTSAFLESHQLAWGNVRSLDFRILNDSSYNVMTVQKWAFIICIISSPIAIAGEAQRMVYAIANGYMSMYGDYTSSALVNRMQIVSRVSMFIGLATRPSKKRAWTYFVLGLPIPIMTLIEGSRSGIMIYILFYIYFFYSFSDWNRIKTSSKESKKRKWMMIGIILILVCIGTPMLYIYGYSRVGHTTKSSDNPIMLILRFFASQGGTARLIGWAERYKGKLPGTCYSLGSIIDRIQGNNFAAFSVASAVNTNKFGSIMSYLDSPYNYTVLHIGVGSSYIAEVYYDFGFVGVIVVNIIIGYILTLLSSYEKVGIIIKSFVFMLFFYMMSIPRGSLLTPLDNIFSKSCLLTVFLIFFLSRRRRGIYEKSTSNPTDTRLSYRRR